ncbi:MAG: low molecular weight protein-tyrosine-phosphatase [Akkermansia sp.]
MSTPRILFVCLGNICRSPAAEIICRQLAKDSNIALHIDSCGTASYHVGSAPDARMQAALRQLGYRYDGHKARQFSPRDFEQFELIIAQDEQNKRDILRLARSPEHQAKVHSMSEWFPAAWKNKHSSVPDPYYGGQQGFEEVIHLLHDSCQLLLEELKSPCKMSTDSKYNPK